VTKLANSRGVSDAECCCAARHSTVNASRAYQTVDGRSEASQFLALLGVRIPEAPQVESKIPPFRSRRRRLSGICGYHQSQ
jgi:hypothetical protein